MGGKHKLGSSSGILPWKLSPSNCIKLTANWDIQRRAIQESLQLRSLRNSGKKMYGDILTILDMN